MNKGFMGLERYEGWVINDRIFIFGWTIPLNYTEIQYKEYRLKEYSHNVCFFIAA